MVRNTSCTMSSVSLVSPRMRSAAE
jgi:hypothetical protein